MINIISEGSNHKAIDIGPLDQLNDFEFKHPRLGTVVKSKLFVGELLNTTGAEVSFRDLPPLTTITFLHKHHTHEEIYVFLKGEGGFQVDDQVFPVREGSIVRVSPAGSRTLSNRSDGSMIYMVIQSKAGALAGYDVSDGYRVEGEIRI